MVNRQRKHEVLTDRVTQRREQILARLVEFLWALFSGVDTADWYSDAAVRARAKEAAAQSRAAQEAIAALTEAALRGSFEIEGQALRPTRVVVPKEPRGVDPLVVWERPAKTYRRERALGLDEVTAQMRAFQRARQLADGDLLVAKNIATVTRMEKSPAIGYRRVIRPELSRTGTCGLCIVAADRVYTKSELMPIHANCKCDVKPVTLDHDPGNGMNKVSLGTLYDDAGGTAGWSKKGEPSRGNLKRQRYRVVQHGELGPILVNVKHKFTGPGDISLEAGRELFAAQLAAASDTASEITDKAS